VSQPVPLLDLKAQFEPLKEAIAEAVERVIDSQRFILGPEVESLEQEIATFVGAEHAVGCASGTDALILALAALDVGDGDRVVTTPFSFFSTASCAYKVGARPKFVDIDPESFNIDPEQAAQALTPDVKALLPVHLFGQCADMDPLLELARTRGVAVIEDAAQALSASYSPASGTPVQAGSMGDLGCYSFFPSKNLGGFGDGGMIVTSRADLADRLRLLRVHGGQQMYHHAEVGWNSRLDSLQAAVLRVKLPHLAGWSQARAANAERYGRLLDEAGLIQSGRTRPPHVSANASHIYNQYTLRVERRDELKSYLGDHGIGNAVYYPVPLHQQECFSELGHVEGDFPNAEHACREVISLPVYPEMTAAQQEQVVSVLDDFYNDAR